MFPKRCSWRFKTVGVVKLVVLAWNSEAIFLILHEKNNVKKKDIYLKKILYFKY